MPSLSRRQLLTWFALAPTLPRFLVQSARATALQAADGHDGRVVVVVRMLGGNDGLNTIVPVRDDRYYRVRPTIGIPHADTIALPGGDLGLNPSLADIHRLMDDGHAAIVQGIGYPDQSRSHTRATEIWEAGSVADAAPTEGWLGRYLDHACECAPQPMTGVQFGDSLGLTLASRTGRSRSIGNTQLLLEMDPDALLSPARGPRAGRLDYLHQVQNSLGESSLQLHRAASGSGASFDYPDTAFGQSLRWTADMIETGCPTRVYYVTIGSFDTPASASFDTHVDQLDKHRILYAELGRGFAAFARHLRQIGRLDEVLTLTFSDFGRQLGENSTRGTDHGDASVLFLVGGAVRPGLLGQPADLGRVHDGGVVASLDFRRVYADVLRSWLEVDPEPILGAGLEPFAVVDRRL